MARITLGLLWSMIVCGCSSLSQQTTEFPGDDSFSPSLAGKDNSARKFDSLLTTITAQRSARLDLKQIAHECGPSGPHYQDGYTQAYVDLAAGRPACVPAAPPPKYRHACRRSSTGARAVEEWYAGYRTGLDYGVNGRVPHGARILPNPEGNCVSAAYVSPYATEQAPNAVLPLSTQVISHGESAEVRPLVCPPGSAENR